MASRPTHQQSQGRARWFSVRMLLGAILLLPLLGTGVLLNDKYDGTAALVRRAEAVELRATVATRLAAVELMLEAEVLVEPIQASLMPLGLSMQDLGTIEGLEGADNLTPIRRLTDQSASELGALANLGEGGTLQAEAHELLAFLEALPQKWDAIDAGEVDARTTREQFRRAADLAGSLRSQIFALGARGARQLGGDETVASAFDHFYALQRAQLAEIYGAAVTVPGVGGLVQGSLDTPDSVGDVIASMVLVDYHTNQFAATAPASVLNAWQATLETPDAIRFLSLRQELPQMLGFDGELPRPDTFNATEFGQLGFALMVDQVDIFDELLDALVVDARATRSDALAEQRTALLFGAGVALATLFGALIAAAALLQPLRSLKRRAASISEGKLDNKPLGPLGPNEVAVVALTMDNLESTLDAMRGQLTAIAAEQTSTHGPSDIPGPLGSLMMQSVARVESLHDTVLEQALTDRLTGLPNRRATVEELSRLMEESNTPTVALFADLDGFKPANDKYGHATGDTLLTIVAQRFKKAAADTGFVGRIGGDEFLMVAPCGDKTEALALGRRLVDSLAEPVRIEDVVFDVAVSVGVALSIDGDETPSDLLSSADLALYAAKGTTDRLVYCGPELRRETSAKRVMAEQLRNAIANNELRLELQPLVEIASGRTVAAEALCRWEVEGNMVAPDYFIEVAEENGLIVELDRWAINEAVRHARQLLDAERAMQIGVNVSWNHLVAGDLYADVIDALTIHGLPAHLLRIELTESVQPTRTEQGTACLSALRDLGVGLSLDDFGTGYSSITHLRYFPFDCLKIDRSLLDNLDDEASLALVEAIIRLCRSLDLDVVCEGIETPEVASTLQGLGCRTGQGWLWSPAMPFDQFLEDRIAVG